MSTYTHKESVFAIVFMVSVLLSVAWGICEARNPVSNIDNLAEAMVIADPAQ